MDYVKPAVAVREAEEAAAAKASLPAGAMLGRAALAGALLGGATSLVQVAWAQGLPPLVGALLFPSGFVVLVLLGLELATGNFALLPLAVAGRRVGVGGMIRNWGWVYLGNMLGSLAYALLFAFVLTTGGVHDGGRKAEEVRQLAVRKTATYRAAGPAGWAAALTSGVLANWLVTLGTMLAFTSSATAGKAAAMWLPIMTFFALGFEHSVVNMYAIPAGMLLGAPVGLADWWLWNQIPVTVGNIVGGGLCTGLAVHALCRGRP